MEWAILLPDNVSQREKDFFINVNQLFFLRIIALGETTARQLDINPINQWMKEEESPTRKGFSPDGQMAGGCKTPEGNAHLKETEIDKQFQLIGTPQELAKYMDDEWYKRDNHLATVLETFKRIYGSDELVSQYQQACAGYLERNRERYLNLLNESLIKFDPFFGRYNSISRYFNAKYDLYRLPTMVIDQLAGYFGINGESVWEKIRALHNKGIIACAAQEDLLNLSSQVLELRLCSYMAYQCRNDVIWDVPDTPILSPVETSLGLSRIELSADSAKGPGFGVNHKALEGIYRTLLPLVDRLRLLLERGKDHFIEHVNQHQRFHTHEAFYEAGLYCLLKDYRKSNQHYTQALKEQEHFYRKVLIYKGIIANKIKLTEDFEHDIAEIELLEPNNSYEQAQKQLLLAECYLRTKEPNLDYVCTQLEDARSALQQWEQSQSIKMNSHVYFAIGLLLCETYVEKKLDLCVEKTIQELEQYLREESFQPVSAKANLLMQKAALSLLRHNHNEALTHLHKAYDVLVKKFDYFHPEMITITNAINRCRQQANPLQAYVPNVMSLLMQQYYDPQNIQQEKEGGVDAVKAIETLGRAIALDPSVPEAINKLIQDVLPHHLQEMNSHLSEVSAPPSPFPAEAQHAAASSKTQGEKRE